MRRSFLLLIPVLLAVPAPAQADLHYVLDSAHSDIRAKVAFLGIASKTVRFPSASGRVAIDPLGDGLRMDVMLDARALTADDKLTRDQLKGPKFFDVAHYPQLHFVGQHLIFTGAKTARLSGNITARGVTRPATLDISFSDDLANASEDQPIRISAAMVIDRDEFGMTAFPLIAGRKVTISIEATMLPA